MAVDNDDEFAHLSGTLGFDLGRRFERLIFQIRTWAGGKQPVGRFDIHPLLVSRVYDLAKEYRAICKVEPSPEPTSVRVVLTRRPA